MFKSDIQPFRMYKNLYFVGAKKVSVHLIDTPEGLVLIDTGYPDMYEQIIDSISHLGFDPKNICAIFHSHGHIDHFGCTKIRCRLTPGHTAGVLSFFVTFDDGTVAAMHGGIGGNSMTIPFLKNTEANFKQYIATYDNP